MRDRARLPLVEPDQKDGIARLSDLDLGIFSPDERPVSAGRLVPPGGGSRRALRVAVEAAKRREAGTLTAPSRTGTTDGG